MGQAVQRGTAGKCLDADRLPIFHLLFVHLQVHHGQSRGRATSGGRGGESRTRWKGDKRSGGVSGQLGHYPSWGRSKPSAPSLPQLWSGSGRQEGAWLPGVLLPALSQPASNLRCTFNPGRRDPPPSSPPPPSCPASQT